MNFTIVGVRTLPGLVGVDADEDCEAPPADAAGELLADATAEAAGDPRAAADAAAVDERFVDEIAAAAASKGAATRVNCSVIPRG